MFAQILFLIIGLVIGFVIASLLNKSKNSGISNEEFTTLQKQQSEGTIKLNVLQEKLNQTESRLKENEDKYIQDLRVAETRFNQEKETLTQNHQQEIIRLVSDKEKELNRIISSTSEQITELKKELTLSNDSLNTANNTLTASREHFKSQEERIAQLKKDIEESRKRLAQEFEVMANKILEDKSNKFTEQNKVNMAAVLEPLGVKIKGFEDQVQKNYNEELRDRLSLKEEVKRLLDLNTKMSVEANNLTKALKGDNKLQGNWGELILEKILERSGLEKGVEYKTQESFKNQANETIRPDAIVYLPDNKHIIIDSKVSLIAYQNAVNEHDEVEREKFLKLHIESIKSHIKGLSDKKYFQAEGLTTPDFVLLFIPIESSFGIAMQTDTELFNYAWERKIVMVSPSTLLATLRTIANIWKFELQNKNALEIAKQSGELYDRFVAFMGDLEKIEKALDNGKSAYDEAIKRLKTGNGNVFKRLENIKKLGAKADKSISDKYFDDEILPLNENI